MTEPITDPPPDKPDRLHAKGPIAADSPCLCGGKTTLYESVYFNYDHQMIRCSDCGLLAVVGDDRWCDPRAGDEGYGMRAIKERVAGMKGTDKASGDELP